MADTAFVDRADIIQYVDLPSREAIYEILRSCLCEIITRGIVSPVVCDIFYLLERYHPTFFSASSNLETNTDI
jgi:SpoVK/Ycf46/Vps4 family AAA+-type ATPase